MEKYGTAGDLDDLFMAETWDASGGEIHLYNNGEEFANPIEGNLNPRNCVKAYDNSTAMFVTKEYDLYFIGKGEVNKIDSDVKKYVFAAYGDGIAYIKNEGGVYHFIAGEEPVKLSDAKPAYIRISPDGHTVGFADLYLYIYVDGQRVERDEDYENEYSQCFGVTNGGALIYVSSRDGRLLAIKDGVETELTLGEKSTPDMMFSEVNADSTEYLYSKEGESLISINGEQPTQVEGKPHILDVALITNGVTRPAEHFLNQNYLVYPNVDDGSGWSYAIMHLDENGASTYSDRTVDNIDVLTYIQPDQSAYWISNDDSAVYKLPNGANAADRYDVNARQIYLDKNNPNVYYFDTKNCLGMISEDGNAETIIEHPDSDCMGATAHGFYYLDEEHNIHFYSDGNDTNVGSLDVREGNKNASNFDWMFHDEIVTQQ